jgi:hypothetical protein
MQAEESLGAQCTCSGYIELHSRAPPSPLQPGREAGGGGQPVSQLFYSLLRHRQYCATSIAPTLSLHPSTCFFHLSTATVRARRRGKLHVAALAVAPLRPWWIILFPPCALLIPPTLLARDSFSFSYASLPELTTPARDRWRLLCVRFLVTSSLNVYVCTYPVLYAVIFFK